MRKFFALISLFALSAWIYQQFSRSRAYDALWTDATSFADEPSGTPDLR
ncbi:MAG: hypothetical protein WCJ48_00980 [Actinomycetes bacterium]